MSKENVRIGTAAPDISLPDSDGKQWRLLDQRGKVVVLLFYPGDETPICTRQMCSVRDRWEDYLATGAEVVVSPLVLRARAVRVCEPAEVVLVSQTIV